MERFPEGFQIPERRFCAVGVLPSHSICQETILYNKFSMSFAHVTLKLTCLYEKPSSDLLQSKS